MANMTERITLTFDKETRQRLQTLVARWRVSQAEVVRRAVARAEEAERMASDPVADLLPFHAQGGLDAARFSGYLEQLQEDRTPLARRIVIALDTNLCVGRRINGSPLAAMYLSRRSGWRDTTFEASMPRTELFDRRRIAIVAAQPSMTLESRLRAGPCHPTRRRPIAPFGDSPHSRF
jgi:Arc/MetJ-type ribon-helix-helix transcriptional regulator